MNIEKGIGRRSKLGLGLFIGSILVLGSGCAVQTTNPNMEMELALVEEVAIIPADIMVGLSKFASDDERMPEIEEAHEPLFQAFAEAALSEKGYSQVDFDFEALSSEQAYLITAFKEELAVSAESPNEWIPLGDAARDLAAQTSADALLFVSYEGIRKSSGEVAQNIGTSILVGVLTAGAYIPVSAQNAGAATGYLVDGISGDILWRKSLLGGENADLVENLLSDLPEASN